MKITMKGNFKLVTEKDNFPIILTAVDFDGQHFIVYGNALDDCNTFKYVELSKSNALTYCQKPQYMSNATLYQVIDGKDVEICSLTNAMMGACLTFLEIQSAVITPDFTPYSIRCNLENDFGRSIQEAYAEAEAHRKKDELLSEWL